MGDPSRGRDARQVWAMHMHMHMHMHMCSHVFTCVRL